MVELTTLQASLLSALVTYLFLVKLLRFRRRSELVTLYNDSSLPLKDPKVAEHVMMVLNSFEMPFLIGMSLEFALFKTYSSPSISKILAGTKQFKDHALKRAEDTGFILMEMTQGPARKCLREMKEHKVDPEEDANDEMRAKVATEKLNVIHGAYNIRQEDYLYTLGLFILEPIDWTAKYEWRPLTTLEQNAILATWTKQGTKMGIKNIPKSIAAMRAFTKKYESTQVFFASTNSTVANATTDLFLTNVPKFLHPLGHQMVASLLTPKLRIAFGMKEPPKMLSKVVDTILYSRALFIRHCMLPRRLPYVRTALRANALGRYDTKDDKWGKVYPQGYKIEELGPEKFLDKCPIKMPVKTL